MPPLANCFYKFTSFLPEGIFLLFVYGNFMENRLKKNIALADMHKILLAGWQWF